MIAESIDKQVLRRIRKLGRGKPFFASNFMSYGDPATVWRALDRLVKAGEIIRVGRGIYVRPKFDEVIGLVRPGMDEIAEAIAKRDCARIAPSGVYALNQLGLSTQVPMRVVYLTDGTGRTIRIGKCTITFKRTTPKNVAAWGKTSRLVIQALRVIGQKKILPSEIKHVQEILRHEDRRRLLHDIQLAPEWIREIMKPALN
jgi:hypothetical protein